MLMTGSSFLLTPQSGEKLIINGFAIIGSFMFLIYFANTLPFHSTEVPIIGKKNIFLKICIEQNHKKSNIPRMLMGVSSHFGF
jgi:hypothetical protein